jgi:hypothetical protein
MTRSRARRWRGALALTAIASSGAACSFVTSFDGLAAGGNDAAPADNGTFGGSDAGESVTTADGAADASVAPPDDAGAAPGADASDAAATLPVDAASEGGTADAGAYCAALDPAPLFCDDFDETPLKTPWDQVTGVGGTVALGTKVFTSPPFSMLVTSTAGAAAIDLAGYKSFTGAATKKTYTLSFELDVQQADTSATTSDAILAAIQLDEAGRPAWDLQLEVNYDVAAAALDVNLSENASFADGGHLYTPHPVSATLPLGVWTRVSMVVVIGTTDAASLAFGAKSEESFTVSPGTVGAYPEILVGGTFAEKSTRGWIVSYDDVTFDAQ